MIKKGNDTNIFISSEAEKTLISMCQNANENKVLSVILTHSGNRSALVKAKVAKCLDQIISKLGAKIKSFRDNSQIINQLATYLSDAGQEVRNNAKQAFNTLNQIVSKEEFEKLMSGCLTEQQYNKVKEMLEKGFQASMSEFSPSKQSFYRGNSNSSTRKRMKASGGNYASDGFEANGSYKGSSIKYKSTNHISASKSIDGSLSNTRNAPYGQRTPFSSKNSQSENQGHPKQTSNKTISIINRSQNSGVQKIVPNKQNSETYSQAGGEDFKGSYYSPSKSSKQQRRISKQSIKKLDEKSLPRALDFSRRETTDNTQVIDENDVFAKLKDPDSKVASKAAESLLNNFEEYAKDLPEHLATVLNTQAALFCSNNDNIKMRAEELIDKVIENVKSSQVVKPI